MLTPEDVVWEPCSPEAVATRAPAGLSSHCSANASLWLTTAILVYDSAVEAYFPWSMGGQNTRNPKTEPEKPEPEPEKPELEKPEP